MSQKRLLVVGAVLALIAILCNLSRVTDGRLGPIIVQGQCVSSHYPSGSIVWAWPISWIGAKDGDLVTAYGTLDGGDMTEADKEPGIILKKLTCNGKKLEATDELTSSTNFALRGKISGGVKGVLWWMNNHLHDSANPEWVKNWTPPPPKPVVLVKATPWDVFSYKGISGGSLSPYHGFIITKLPAPFTGVIEAWVGGHDGQIVVDGHLLPILKDSKKYTLHIRNATRVKVEVWVKAGGIVCITHIKPVSN